MATTHTHETTAEAAAREAREQAARDAQAAAKQAEHDAKVLEARRHETREQRIKREAEEAAQVTVTQQVARVAQLRIELQRARDVFQTSTAGIVAQLDGLSAATNAAEVKAAAKALADEYDVTLDSKGLIQPPAPKAHK